MTKPPATSNRPPGQTNEDSHVNVNHKRSHRGDPIPIWLILTLVAFIVGSVGGYFVGFNSHSLRTSPNSTVNLMSMEQINPSEGYPINARFGDIGPKLVAAGAFRPEDFINIYERSGQPLSEKQIEVLKSGSDDLVVLNKENAYFLLNLFWALGLANHNPILENGPMMNRGRENVNKFASTGGWSLAIGPIDTLFSSARIVTLTSAQQRQLEDVVIAIYRPCCDNPTHFPDCNHGMAMLGLLELMASQGASVDEMFKAAKYANAYWFPSQSLELATYFQAKQNVSFDKVDSRQLVSKSFSSLSGYQVIDAWLTANGMLPQAPSGGGGSCGV